MMVISNKMTIFAAKEQEYVTKNLSIMVLMILQLCIVLGALWVGSRYGSLALGAISGIGLALLVFGFGLKPGTPRRM